MNPTGAHILTLLLTFSTAAAQDKPTSPAEQYKALLKDHQAASSSGRVLTDDERMQFIGRVYQHRHQIALKFVELAEKYRNDPIAIDALVQATWQVNTNPWPVEMVGKDIAAPRALAILQRDHIKSDKLGPVCQRVSYGFCKEYESFLRAVLAQNPQKNIQAQACLGLAHFLSNRLKRLDLLADEPALAKEFAGLFGADYLGDLQRQDRGKADKDAEAFFEQAIAKYGDVKLSGGGTVGEKAKAELFEIRHLSVGKPALEMEGEDQDGKTFKLSDYRGKVVLIDFWSEA